MKAETVRAFGAIAGNLPARSYRPGVPDTRRRPARRVAGPMPGDDRQLPPVAPPLAPVDAMRNWRPVDHIVVGYHSPGLFYARNLSLKQEAPPLHSRDACWDAILRAVKCYDSRVFMRASSAVLLVAGSPGGISTHDFGRRYYQPTRKLFQPGQKARIYLRDLARLGLVQHKTQRGGYLRWTLTDHGRAMLDLRHRWDAHRAQWGKKG